MAAQAKPDSSYASNHLTRTNPPPKHLLSTFNKPEPKDTESEVAGINKEGFRPSVEIKPEIDTDAEPLSSDEDEAEGTKQDAVQSGIEKNVEIDTDAEPLSSDEEEVEEPVPDIPRRSIENKLDFDTDTEPLSSPPPSSPPLSSYGEEAEHMESNVAQSSIKRKTDIDTDADPLSSDEEQASDSDASPPRKEVNYTTRTLEKKLAEGNTGAYSSSQNHDGYSRKSDFARTLSAMTGSDSDNEPLFSSGCSRKRRKAATYVSKSYFNRPNFSPRPVVQAKEPSPVEEAPKEPEETFIMPKDIENSSFREPRGGEDSNSSFSHGPYTIEDYEAMRLYDDDDSPLSSPSSSTCEQMLEADKLAAKENHQPLAPGPALCPMCHKEVDWPSLELFKSQPKQRIREQVLFCESHKLRSAMDLWRERGYPKIDWDGLEERVQSYFPELEKLLVPGAFSYYRNILSTSFAPGKAKNFRVRVSDGERLETMACGYYGTRGATRIAQPRLETIIRRFSVVVRRLATTDDLIKTAGVAGYTQSVLVPELAVLMVKDDMKVNDEDARRIMRESMDIGNRVHPDLNVVPIPDDVD
ncbi:unnamed protein product [Penicillium glandicola]